MRRDLLWSSAPYLVISALVLATCVISGTSASAGIASARHAAVTIKPRTIALIDFSAASPADAATDEAVNLAAKRLGWKVQFTDAQVDPAKAASAMSAAVTQNVDAILFVAGDASYVKQGLLRAKQKGIPAIQIAAGAVSPLFTASYVENEQQLAEPLSQYVFQSQPKAKVGALTASIIPAGDIRFQNLKRVATSRGGKIVASSEPGFTDPRAAQKQVSDMLTANPEINAIWTVFDNYVQGAAAGIRGTRSKAKLYSFYASPANLALLRKDSPLEGVVDNLLPKTAAVAMDQLLYHFEKSQPFDPNALKKDPLPITVYDRSNVPASPPWSAKTILKRYFDKWQRDFPGAFGR